MVLNNSEHFLLEGEGRIIKDNILIYQIHTIQEVSQKVVLV